MNRSEHSACEEDLEALTYAISHDLRAPLRAISGFSRILVEDHADALDEEGRRVVEVIQRNVGKLNRRIVALLDLSRVGRQPLDLTDVDMLDAARRAWADITGPDTDATLSIAELPTVPGDRDLLVRLWRELLDNAVKFSDGQARVEVCGDTDDGHARFVVRDHGIGYDPQHADALFAPLQVLHDRSSDGTGIGIGLAVARRIVRRHGGQISAESLPEGVAVRFSLPLSVDVP